MTVKKPAEDSELEIGTTLIGVNLTGVFYFAQYAGCQMIQQGYGNIINISSVGGETRLPNRLLIVPVRMA